MKSDLKVKLLQHLNRKKGNQGFTLVELLVVIIIIGILAAIALPNFLSQGAKAKQSEAKQNIGLVNRTQTAYRSESNTFADSFDKLAIGTLTGAAAASTTNYDYALGGGADTATISAQAKDASLKAYSGGNSRFTNTENNSVIASAVCEADTPGTGAAVTPTVSDTAAPACPGGYKTLGQ